MRITITVLVYWGFTLKKSLLSLSISLAILPLSAVSVAVEQPASARSIEKMVVIGSTESARSLPGSGAVVTAEQLKTEVITDINQALKTVPGIYIREEDGLGLRPNIGIRGATSERSEKITLMEDGVLIAPAPYSNPAAYYFPTAMRMSMFEVLKGAPLLRYGPQTTGGVVNMLSTPIPEEFGGSAVLSINQRGSTDIHAFVGGKKDGWGVSVETVQRDGDGFKDIDGTSKEPEYDISDYVVKLGWEGEQQSVLLKLQRSDEVSNETYLGLTDDDFDEDPNRRYGLSSIDEMDNDHKGVNLTHIFQWSDTVTSTTTVYRNEFSRDWFKYDAKSGDFYDTNDSKLIDAANAGDAGAQNILNGTVVQNDLEYKHNNREYISQGLQFNFDMDFGDHQFAVGARAHHDEMDRFQPVDTYNQLATGELVYISTSASSATGVKSKNNRVEHADALTGWFVDSWQVNDELNVNLALRYEDINSSRKQYDTTARTDAPTKTSNDTSIWLPGVSFTYDLSDKWQVLAGVHKGFSPIGGGAEDNQDPEESKNWEAGVRFNHNEVFVEAIVFYSDFSNKVENCSVGSPCSNDETSGTLEGGDARISGLELQVSTFVTAGEFTLPIDATYTYTDAKYTEDSTDGDLQSGYLLKDVPEQIASVRVGLEHDSGWNNYIVAKYIDGMCSTAGCNDKEGEFLETESLFVADFISRIQLEENVEVFFKTENIFDTQHIVSRSPDGARPNKPRTTSIGVKYDF